MNEKTENLRSFMFYESYRDSIKGFMQLGEGKAAKDLAREIMIYGFTGKRSCKLENIYAEMAMCSFAPLIDKSIQHKDETMKSRKEDYGKNLKL